MDQLPYWNVDDPTRPWGWFDPNAQLAYPMNWQSWLTGLQATYVSHQIICESGIKCDSSSHANGIITALLHKDANVALRVGKKYRVTWRVVALDINNVTQTDDRSIYLKIKER